MTTPALGKIPEADLEIDSSQRRAKRPLLRGIDSLLRRGSWCARTGVHLSEDGALASCVLRLQSGEGCLEALHRICLAIGKQPQ